MPCRLVERGVFEGELVKQIGVVRLVRQRRAQQLHVAVGFLSFEITVMGQFADRLTRGNGEMICS